MFEYNLSMVDNESASNEFERAMEAAACAVAISIEANLETDISDKKKSILAASAAIIAWHSTMKAANYILVHQKPSSKMEYAAAEAISRHELENKLPEDCTWEGLTKGRLEMAQAALSAALDAAAEE
jgi:hypothetical protein